MSQVYSQYLQPNTVSLFHHHDLLLTSSTRVTRAQGRVTCVNVSCIGLTETRPEDPFKQMKPEMVNILVDRRIETRLILTCCDILAEPALV